MQNTLTTTRLSNLEYAVLRTVVYSALFDYALTPGEVWHNLPVPASLADLERAVRGLQEAGLLVAHSRYVMLTDKQHLAGVREQRREPSRVLRREAETYGRLIARLPFVRMVALTGSLAVDNAEAGDDLDYLIVTADGRVWLTRAMTMLIVRLAALRGVTLCPNYLLAESAIELPERDFYTARELRQMVPIAGHAVYARMLAVNAWWCDFLPNAGEPATELDDARQGMIRRATERVLRLAPFDRLEAWLLARKGGELRHGAGPEAVFDETMCKGHFEGWRERTRRMVDERMQQLLEATS